MDPLYQKGMRKKSDNTVHENEQKETSDPEKVALICARYYMLIYDNEDYRFEIYKKDRAIFLRADRLTC